MKLTAVAACFLLAATFCACGDELVGEEIGCDWFSGENCWKASLTAAADCLHPTDDIGTLSADGTQCDFTDGTQIVFLNPIDLANMDYYRWNFEIHKDDAICMSFCENSSDRRTLTTSLGVYWDEPRGLGIQISCPSGTKYKVLVASNLITCENFKKILPGIKAAWENAVVSFTLTGGPDGDTPIFTCHPE
ncbi:MAG TPA: hypothetical protein VM425_00295 [Myxococcota bacterium]|nr:hypothetical protein [Myxococcota bacterium]